MFFVSNPHFYHNIVFFFLLKRFEHFKNVSKICTYLFQILEIYSKVKYYNEVLRTRMKAFIILLSIYFEHFLKKYLRRFASCLRTIKNNFRNDRFWQVYICFGIKTVMVKIWWCNLRFVLDATELYCWKF